MSNPVISAKGLVKGYGKGAVVVKALRGVDLDIPRGSFTCIVGPSGHGKSTLMHLLGGLDHPTSGKVSIDGQEMFRLGNKELADLRARKIGFVFQFFNLLQSLTARENIETALMLAGVPEKEQAKRAKELLAIVGLEDKADSKPGQLSGGQQQRVAVARALASKPKYILADEPTANLDSKNSHHILQTMIKLNEELDTTFIFATHDEKVMKYLRRKITLSDGMVASDKILVPEKATVTP